MHNPQILPLSVHQNSLALFELSGDYSHGAGIRQQKNKERTVAFAGRMALFFCRDLLHPLRLGCAGRFRH
jgi:hypothetical protein